MNSNRVPPPSFAYGTPPQPTLIPSQYYFQASAPFFPIPSVLYKEPWKPVQHQSSIERSITPQITASGVTPFFPMYNTSSFVFASPPTTTQNPRNQIKGGSWEEDKNVPHLNLNATSTQSNTPNKFTVANVNCDQKTPIQTQQPPMNELPCVVSHTIDLSDIFTTSPMKFSIKDNLNEKEKTEDKVNVTHQIINPSSPLIEEEIVFSSPKISSKSNELHSITINSQSLFRSITSSTENNISQTESTPAELIIDAQSSPPENLAVQSPTLDGMDDEITVSLLTLLEFSQNSGNGNQNINNEFTLNKMPNSINSSTEMSEEVPQGPEICVLKKGTCLVCTREAPPCLSSRSPSWSAIMHVVLFALHHAFPTRSFFGLQSDIYPLVSSHWSKLFAQKTNVHNWHKQLQDSMSHKRKLFQSGKGNMRKNGFWRLKVLKDPWFPTDTDVNDQNLRNSPLTTPPQSPQKLGKRRNVYLESVDDPNNNQKRSQTNLLASQKPAKSVQANTATCTPPHNKSTNFIGTLRKYGSEIFTDSGIFFEKLDNMNKTLQVNNRNTSKLFQDISNFVESAIKEVGVLQRDIDDHNDLTKKSLEKIWEKFSQLENLEMFEQNAI